jgi:hypothetical protein
MSKGVISVNEACSFPNGYTMTDNRIEDYLQKFLSPAAYTVWRQYLRFWGGDKSYAYPSLSVLKERTGMSEKTIRKCNKELAEKGFLTYQSGHANRANQYTYVPIEDIMVKYYGQETIITQSDYKPPIKEKVEPLDKLYSKIKKSNIEVVENFLLTFKRAYREKMNCNYALDAGDVNAIVKNVDRITEETIFIKQLIEVYFTTKNNVITQSDRSIVYFFQPKTQKILTSEHSNSDHYRWLHQAEAIWATELEQQLGSYTQDVDVKKFIKDRVKLPGANKERDQFILEYLIDKFKSYLTTN